MKVPIRVYNNVAGAYHRGVDNTALMSATVGRASSAYNLLWPVVSQRGPIPPGKVSEGSKEPPKRSSLRSAPSLAPNLGTYEDLQDYARSLLASFPDPQATGVRIKLPIEAIHSTSSGDPDLEQDPDSPTGCRQAVEVLTRNPKKGVDYCSWFCRFDR